jgi:hypothetical protein
MSVNQIIGQVSHSIPKIGQSPQKAQKPATNETSFMDVLRDKFAEVTSQMQGVPGMPGIYSFNAPDTNLITPDNTSVSFVI